MTRLCQPELGQPLPPSFSVCTGNSILILRKFRKCRKASEPTQFLPFSPFPGGRDGLGCVGPAGPGCSQPLPACLQLWVQLAHSFYLTQVSVPVRMDPAFVNRQERVWSISCLENEATHPNDVGGTDGSPHHHLSQGSACPPWPTQQNPSIPPSPQVHDTLSQGPPEELFLAKAMGERDFY